ncbi:hypothetical protein [Streptomyces pratensis]|uniref:hypothetical protein n=1 Tax=Streptomyces pratensis TaxID=1169025 RepID=UPI00193324D7|nr:hypothetical protein [Streptomyces pratensis]
MTAEQGIRLNSTVRAEINLPCPATGEAYRDLVSSWFTRAVRALAGPLGDTFHEDLDLTEQALAHGGTGPCGAPGTLWASLRYDTEIRGRWKEVETHWSPENHHTFQRELGNMPVQAGIQLALLDGEGQPGEPWLEVFVIRENETPDVVSLVAVRTAEEFENHTTARPAQTRWEELLREQLAEAETSHIIPLYAAICDDAEYISGRTALEDGLGLLLEDTLPELESTLRGYSWLTVCSPGVTAALGGPQALAAADDTFAEVTPLPGGGVWLKATEDIHSYTDARVRAVFRALAPVLPPGKPVPSLAAEVRRLVFEAPE